MNPLMYCYFRIINRGHINFLINKMLNGVVFKILDCFLADPLTFFFLLSNIKQLIKNTK